MMGGRISQRSARVRVRINRILHRLEPQGKTIYGTFATRARELALERAMKYYTGNPKDHPAAVRKFCEGKRGAYNYVLDVWELTCEVMEGELGAFQLRAVSGDDSWSRELEKGKEAFFFGARAVERLENEQKSSAALSELQAAAEIFGILDDFEQAGRERILLHISIAFRKDDDEEGHEEERR